MSMPASTCFPTTAATAERIRDLSAAASTGTPSSLANIACTRSSARGRLPVWVVRKRSVLRFIAQSVALLETRHDLLAQQLQRSRHRLVRNQGAEIELRPDAVQSPLLVPLLEAGGDSLRPADDHLVAPHLLIRDRLDGLRLRRATAIGRILQPGAQSAVAGHDARLGLLQSPPIGIRDMQGQPQINFALARMASRFVGRAIGC